MNPQAPFTKFTAVILLASLLLSLLTVYASSESSKKKSALPEVGARAATLYVPELQQFLYEKNADARLPMASTTKIMTALVALDEAELSELVKIDSAAIGIEGSSAYLREGDVYTLEELLYALLLSSANDAAVAIACHVAGSVEDFSALMNEKAESMSLSDTHFSNPHGLDAAEHYTTARELALIAARALECDTIKEITSTYKKTFTRGERQRTYVNHNKLLLRYEGAVGVKTGFTKKCGRCLVGAAERNGLKLISVTLDAPNDWSDHERMLDYGYSTYEKINLAKVGEISYELPVIGGDAERVRVYNSNEANIILPCGDHEINTQVMLDRFVTAPIKAGDTIGTATVTVDGEVRVILELVAEKSVRLKQKKKFTDMISELFKN